MLLESYLVEVNADSSLPILSEMVVRDLLVVLDRHCGCLAFGVCRVEEVQITSSSRDFNIRKIVCGLESFRLVLPSVCA
jgi:hypothetical protein